MIPLARTETGPAEARAVARVMASGRIAFGPEMLAFEKEFAEYHDVPAAVMVNSGTSGLMVALMVAGVQPGDEVIIPALTFIGTANAVLGCSAIPVLVDVDPNTANLDPGSLERAITKKTKAIIPVHLFGLTADMTAIMQLANRHRLPVIEDACEAIGATCNGRKSGASGIAGVFGFYPNKILTTGEGGMVIARDTTFIKRCRAVINQGRGLDAGLSLTGYSLRGTELGAAIGREQLKTLDNRLHARAGLADRYRRSLDNIPDIEIPWPIDTGRSWFTFPTLLPEKVSRERVMRMLADQGIESADYFPALHTLPGLTTRVKMPGEPVHSENLSRRLLSLPFWPGVEEHLEAICTALHLAIEK